MYLIEAATGASPQNLAMLNLLTRHSDAELLPLDIDHWHRIATAATLYGGTGRACAVLPVIDHDAGYVMTGEPDAYPGADVLDIRS